jgi:hypothetical protein
MKEQPQAHNFESRWPVVVTILAVILLLEMLPRHIMLLPLWAAEVCGAVVLTPVVGVWLAAAKAPWLRIERMVTLLYAAIAALLALANLWNLIHAMVIRSEEITGVQLLASSIAVWVTNVLTFSLLYWQLDRGGPEARVNNAGARPDWLFPQEGAPAQDVPQGWKARFVDYLFLSYATATAFSTTDVMPLTSRAKLLMMLESTISLATIIIVGARAINVIGQ